MKLNCYLPWVNVNTENNGTVCYGKEKFKEFKTLSMSILKQNIHNEIEDLGCFIPNCRTRKWTICSHVTDKISKITNDTQMELLYMFSADTKVLFKNEVT